MIRTLLLGSALCLAAPALAAPMSGATFAHKAAMSDMFEIESSKAALGKSSSAQVKDFANMMIKDHTMSSANLAKAAKASNTPVDKSLDAEHQAKLDKMKSMSGGASWDKAYMDAQVQAHTMTLATLKDYAANGSVPQLKSFASDTSKVVAMHLDHAKKLDSSVK